MKFLLSIALLFLISAGCSDDKKEPAKKISSENINKIDTTDITTTPVANPDQNFLMRYKLEPNKDYKYRIATITDNSQTIQVDTTISQITKQTMIYLLDIKLVEIDSDSVFDIVCTINSIKSDANANGQNFSYQSGVTTDSMELLRYSNYESLINNQFNLRVNNIGEIVDIYKTDKIISRYLELQKLTDSLSTEEKTLLKEQIIEGAIRPLLSQVFRKLPEKSVAKDSDWKVSQPPSSFLVFQLQNNNIYTVTSLEEFDEDKVAVINAEVDSKITGDQKLTEQGVTYEFNKPVSEASGKIYFNVDKGCVQKSRIKSKISISFTMEGDTPQGKQKGSRSDVMEYTNIVELL